MLMNAYGTIPLILLLDYQDRVLSLDEINHEYSYGKELLQLDRELQLDN
jgi:hypothetical protein